MNVIVCSYVKIFMNGDKKEFHFGKFTSRRPFADVYALAQVFPSLIVCSFYLILLL